MKINKVVGPRPVSEAEIHPTAVVHPSARLGHNVKVGPHSVIGPDVVMGPDCVVGSSVLIEGHTTIGRNNRFFHGAAIGCEPQDKKFRGETTFLEIGDNNDFREYVTVHLATEEGAQTRVGNNNLVMAYVHIAHNCHIHDDCVIANAVNLAGHVEVGNHATIGGLTPVHQFVRIGPYAFIGGASRLSQDVPPFVKVAGSPVEVRGINSIGLKRNGFTDDDLKILKKAYRILYRSGLNVTQAVDRIAADCKLTKHTETLMAFIRRSDRGIVR
ncbi:MAG: acyl-ACP--UDP-N-acetylglucosamine O-acyltransferase [Candidatus Krumholzibacteriota bacterium]